jgi:CsoR family transcriptional regulator, copper-sensing transcriptional repressor
MMNDEERQRVSARLKRIQGQVAGIQRMIDEKKYCVDILLQISAAQAALGQAGRIILGAHIDTCVAEAFAHGTERERQNKIRELLDVFDRYGKLKTR